MCCDASRLCCRLHAVGAAGRGENPFWRSVRRVERAAAERDAAAFRRASEKHMALVVDLLRPPVGGGGGVEDAVGRAESTGG
jgi:hypothetical protein